MRSLYRYMVLLMLGFVLLPSAQSAESATAEIPLLVLASTSQSKLAGKLVPNQSTSALLTYLEKESGLRFRVMPMPWNRAMAMATAGEGAIYGLSKTQEREAIFDFSELVHSNEVLLVTHRDKVFPFRSLEDLRGKRVGVQLGGTYDDAFERAKNTVFIADETASGATARFKQVLAGRIDVALYGNGRRRFERMLAGDPERTQFLVALDQPLTRNERYFAFPKQAKAQLILQHLNAAIIKGVKTGIIEDLMMPVESKDTLSENKLAP